MKTAFLLLASAALLAACSDGTIDGDEDVVTLEGEQASGPTRAGSYEVVVEGEVMGTTDIEPDGRYASHYADGTVVTGQIRRESATRICFVPDGDFATTCFSEGDPRPDGSYEVVGDDGTTATIRPAG
ncbi:hypothetical protein [Sphingomicrobium marinum]|uniref:hypothetical protein n=1 Tax=Sphingomicrobium marinum TaxID=1227950 RepID=UPI0022404E38|nr:hypothetical protein [Sphingomicrobium marinum]